MSLLLDALKKAAEKKAQKDAESAAPENTEVLTRAQAADDETIADETVAMTELDATHLDATHLDATHVDATHVDATQVDETQLDATQADHPGQETAQELDVSGLDLSSLHSAESSTDDDSKEKDSLPENDDEASLDAARIDATQIDATEINSTELNPIQLDRASTHTAVKIEATPVGIPQANQDDKEATLELDIKNLDLSRLAAEQNEVVFDSGADETLSFIDEDEGGGDNGAEDETVVLTPDDITEFLGDVSYPEQKEPAKAMSPSVRKDISDDTTITNSDSLSLTNIEQDDQEASVDEEYPLTQDSGSESNNDNPYSARASQKEYARMKYSPTQSDEGDQSTKVNADSTSSSVDIEKLTNDETVTIKDSTFTRTFAPDNYDRTLMKLTDNDASRIFPGMRSETDSVMTPDYAKKVFITKSRSVKNYYYKVYAGIALCILLVVVIWGLFEVQSESEAIDNSLIALKRDPMPGVIKPKEKPEPVNLFPSTPQVDNKAIKIIQKANRVEDAVAGDIQSADPALQAKGDTPAQSVSSNDSVASLETPVQKSNSVNAPSSAVKKQPSARSKTAPLTISSTDRVSEKDQLLAEAYAAYEAGDIDKARRQYQQVISLDPENRDALLGRAAIHVFDNQFENAISLYQKILLSNPKDDLAMTSLISVANVDPKTGETEIKRLLNELPKSPYLHFALGNMFGNQNRWPEAQSQYFKALQYKPTDPNYAYNLAISLEHLDKSSSAIAYYQRALDNKANGLATFNEQVVMQRIEVLSQ